MTEYEINEKIRQAYTHSTPDILDAVLSDCKKEKGCAIMMTTNKKRKSLVTQLAGIAACLCLLIGGGAVFHNYQINHIVDATVSLDVNPSVEIQVNQKERVLKVIPLNQDGEIIIGDMDFSGSDVNVAVNAMIGSMLQNGYLNELANSILISVDNQDLAKGAALQERLTAEVNKLLQTDTFNGAVLSQTVSKSDELQKLAEKYDITMGKAQLIRDILSESSLHTFDELAHLSINELNLLLHKNPTATIQVETVGTASDKAYIGEAKAKEIVLGKAGVNANNVTAYKVELDTHQGIMVYDVEFISEGLEYDCEINAVTGEVIKFEKEKDDDPVAVPPAQENNPPAPAQGSNPPAPAQENNPPAPAQESNPSAAVAAPDNSNQPNGNQTTGEITLEKAKEIALKHAGVDGSNLFNFKGELDRDDGMLIYELEFESGGYEYDYEINAVTGAILKSEKEWDD